MNRILKKSLALVLAATMALGSVPLGFSNETVGIQESSGASVVAATAAEDNQEKTGQATGTKGEEKSSTQSTDTKEDEKADAQKPFVDEQGKNPTQSTELGAKGDAAVENTAVEKSKIEQPGKESSESQIESDLSRVIGGQAIMRHAQVFAAVEKKVQVNFSNSGTGAVLLYVDGVYAGYQSGSFGPGNMLSRELPVGTQIEAYAISDGGVYNYAAWSVVIHNTVANLTINQTTQSSLFSHVVNATDVSINVSPWTITGNPSDQLAVTVKSGKEGSVEGYRGIVDSGSKFCTINANETKSSTLTSNMPITLKATPKAGVNFKGWMNRQRVIIGTDLTLETRVTAENNYFEAVYESEYDKNFNEDKTKNQTLDVLNRGFLNAKSFELRDVTHKNRPDINLPIVGDDISGMYGVERSKSVLLSPVEGFNGTTSGTFPWNSTTDGVKETGKLYWGESNSNENSHNMVVDFWGFFVPEKTGYYKVGVTADDGARGWITVNNRELPIASEYTYHGPKICVVGSSEGSEETLLQAGKIYPIKINYFENNVVGTTFAINMTYRASTAENASNWLPVPGSYFYPDTDLHKHFVAAPIQFNSPEATVGAFGLTNGTAQKNSHLTVKVIQGTDVVEKSVTVDSNGQWTQTFSADEMKAFEEGTHQVVAEYKDVTGAKKEAAIKYSFAYDFTLTADNRYELYVDGVRVEDSKIVGPRKTAQYGWDYAKKYLLNLDPSRKHVIAIKGIDEGVIGGIKSELTFNGQSIPSDASNYWKHFEGVVSPEWINPAFNDSGWTTPTVVKDSRWSPLKNFPLNSNAQWIWASNNTVAKMVYFRLTVGQQPTFVDIKGVKTLDVPKKGQAPVSETYTATVLDQDGVPMTFDASKLLVNASGSRTDYMAGKTGQLTLTSESAKGNFNVSVSYNGQTLPTRDNSPYTVTVSKEDSVATSLEIRGNKTLNVPSIHEPILKAQYLGVAYDQYGAEMPGIRQSDVKITFANLPNAILANNKGMLTVKPRSSAGTFAVNGALTVKTATGEQTVVTDPTSPFTVVVSKAALIADSVAITGPNTIILPTFDALPLMSKFYKGVVRDQFGKVLNPNAALEIINLQDFNGVSINKLNSDSNGIRVSPYPSTKEGTLALKVVGVDSIVSGNDYRVELKKAPSIAKLLTLTSDLDDKNLAADSIVIPSVGTKNVVYTAQVIDQYNEVMKASASLSTDKSFGGFKGGILTADRSTDPTTFNVVATYGTLKPASIAVNLQKEAVEPKVVFADQDGKIYTKVSDLIEIPVKDGVSKTYKAVVLDQYDDLTNIVPSVAVNGLNASTQGITWEPQSGILKVTALAKPAVGDLSLVIEAKAGSSVAKMSVGIDYAPSIPSLKISGKEVVALTATGTADELYVYKVLDQYTRDLTASPAFPVKLEAYWLVKNGTAVERKALPQGMTFDASSLTLKTDASLATGTYELAIDGTFSNRLDTPFTKIPDTLLVKVTKAAPVVPQPNPQSTPQAQTRGERGGTPTFANVIIADELTPLGAVKFNNAYMVGYPNHSFKPGQSMTRAEAAAVFANVLGLNRNVKSGVKFGDVPTSAWYYGAVQASVKVGLLTTSNGKFNPNEPVTRADMAAAFAKFWELNNIKVSDKATKTTDISGHWAEKQINKALNAKLMAAYDDGTFKPDAPATREQTAVMFNKLIARGKINKIKPSFNDVSLDYWAAGDIEAAVVKMNILGK